MKSINSIPGSNYSTDLVYILNLTMEQLGFHQPQQVQGHVELSMDILSTISTPCGPNNWNSLLPICFPQMGKDVTSDQLCLYEEPSKDFPTYVIDSYFPDQALRVSCDTAFQVFLTEIDAIFKELVRSVKESKVFLRENATRLFSQLQECFQQDRHLSESPKNGSKLDYPQVCYNVSWELVKAAQNVSYDLTKNSDTCGKRFVQIARQTSNKLGIKIPDLFDSTSDAMLTHSLTRGIIGHNPNQKENILASANLGNEHHDDVLVPSLNTDQPACSLNTLPELLDHSTLLFRSNSKEDSRLLVNSEMIYPLTNDSFALLDSLTQLGIGNTTQDCMLNPFSQFSVQNQDNSANASLQALNTLEKQVANDVFPQINFQDTPEKLPDALQDQNSVAASPVQVNNLQNISPTPCVNTNADISSDFQTGNRHLQDSRTDQRHCRLNPGLEIKLPTRLQNVQADQQRTRLHNFHSDQTLTIVQTETQHTSLDNLHTKAHHASLQNLHVSQPDTGLQNLHAKPQHTSLQDIHAELPDTAVQNVHAKAHHTSSQNLHTEQPGTGLQNLHVIPQNTSLQNLHLEETHTNLQNIHEGNTRTNLHNLEGTTSKSLPELVQSDDSLQHDIHSYHGGAMSASDDDIDMLPTNLPEPMTGEDLVGSVRLQSLKESSKIPTLPETAQNQQEPIQTNNDLVNGLENTENTIQELSYEKSKNSNKTSKFECKECNKVYKHRKNYRAHLMSKHGEKMPFECDACGKQFSRSFEFNRHKDTHTGKAKFKCPECTKTYFLKSSLDLHIMKHHSEKRPFICSVCNFGFIRNYDLKEHMKTHAEAKPFKCKYCDRSFLLEKYLIRHLSIHTGKKSHFCTICNEGFISAHFLSKHAKKHNCDIERHVICVFCNKPFSLEEFKDHLLTHKTEKALKCDICKRTDFRDEQELLEHRKQHSGDKRFVCVTKLCDKTFKTFKELENHRLTHTVKTVIPQSKLNRQSVVCDMCGKAVQKNRLKSHLNYHHGEKTFKCDKCHKSYHVKRSLQIHLMSKHDGVKPFSCQSCSKKFPTKYDLQKHNKIHKKEHKCHICSRAFANGKYLLEHMTVHTGEKPFACQLCPEAFARYTHLARHCKQVHDRHVSGRMVQDKGVKST